MKPSLTFKTLFSFVLTILSFGPISPLAHAQGGDRVIYAALSRVDQPVKFEHFTVKDGLADDMVYQVLQSKQGFIWVASRGGLNKYDGAEFTTYAHDPENPNSLASNCLWTMREALDGTLWLSLWGGGLDKFDPVTETFTHYRHEEGNLNSLGTDLVNASFQDSRGFIWVAHDKGLDRLDPQTNTFKHYLPDPNNPNSLSGPGNQILEGEDGILWIGTYAGLDKFDPASETFTHYLHEEGNTNSLSGGYVWALYRDQAGILWVGAEGGSLNRFDPVMKPLLIILTWKVTPPASAAILLSPCWRIARACCGPARGRPA